jgi:hypothetical protein
MAENLKIIDIMFIVAFQDFPVGNLLEKVGIPIPFQLKP